MKKQLLSSLLGAALVASAPAAVLREGHTDLGIAYEGGKLFPHIHDGENDVEYTPGTALLLVRHEAYATIPAGAEYDFLRTGGETHVWLLPAVESPGLLFLGFGTEEIDPGVLVNDEVKIALTSITAPPGGKFACYETDAFGLPTVLFNSADGISTADTRIFPTSTHQDLNWAFSQPGDYRVEFTFTARDGTIVKTAKGVYRFHAQSAEASTGADVLISRDGVALDQGGVVITSLQNAGIANDVLTVMFSGEGVTTADNSAIIRASATGLSTVLVREGEEPANAPGLKVSMLSSPVSNAAGALVFSGTLLAGAGVTAASDAYLAFKDGPGFTLVAREGDVAAGQPADWKWGSFGTRVLAANGVLNFHATAVNRTGPTPLTRSGWWRRLTDGTVAPLAVTGTVLTTEIGPKTVKSIATLNPGVSRDQDFAVAADGALSLLVSFSDGTASVVRLD